MMISRWTVWCSVAARVLASGLSIRHPCHFRIRSLPAETFAPLFHLSGAELRQHGAVRYIADGPRPCRISFTDARPGDELILVIL
jgi:hypothetical protein